MRTIERASLRAPRDLVFETVSLGQDLGPGELHAETLYSALSIGTELAAYGGLPPLRHDVAPYPRLLGYCNVAVVRETGPETPGFREGDFILTTQSHQSGFVCAAAEVLALVPPGVDLRGAALAYLAFLGASSLEKAKFQPGEWVTVMGLGPIGLAAVKWLACSQGHTIAIARRPAQLERARRFGASVCLDAAAPDLVRSVVEATERGGSDIVLTTINAWPMWRVALEICRPHGRIAVLGFPGRGEPPPAQNPLDSSLFYLKQLNILSCGHVSEWDAGGVNPAARRRELIGSILDLMAHQRLDLTPLISAIVPFRQLEALYRKAEDRDENFITGLLRWPAAEEAGL